MISREEALADPTYALVPDIFVIETDLSDPMGGLRLMSELRSRSQTRHAAICIIKAGASGTDNAIAYDLGANDLVQADVDPRELGIRLTRLLHRKREADRLRASVRDGLRLAVIDPLTGLYNRRYAVSQLAKIAQSAGEAGTPFAVMVVDLDRFKSVNDQHGHPAGDAVLVEVARRLATNLRNGDLLARIGGEEFLIALPGTDLSKAGPIAERLCKSIQERPVVLPGLGNIDLTASIGLAICDAGRPMVKEQVTEVIDRADQALLIAKSGGRNQVTISKTAA
jgi:two-component system cell cycle response regulator